jgi:hypothetical protein
MPALWSCDVRNVCAGVLRVWLRMKKAPRHLTRRGANVRLIAVAILLIDVRHFGLFHR